MPFHYSDNIWRMLACHGCEGSALERINEGIICNICQTYYQSTMVWNKPCGYLSYVQDAVVR